MEQPLYQDGPPADEDHTGLVRITKFDVERREAVAQYAYPVERAAPGTALNGVSDVLALSDTSLPGCEIRVQRNRSVMTVPTVLPSYR